MMNASVPATNRSDSNNDTITKWQRYSGARGAASSQATESMLFDTIFTASFFQSQLPVAASSASPLLPADKPQPVEVESNSLEAEKDVKATVENDKEKEAVDKEEVVADEAVLELYATVQSIGQDLQPSVDEAQSQSSDCQVERCYYKPKDERITNKEDVEGPSSVPVSNKEDPSDRSKSSLVGDTADSKVELATHDQFPVNLATSEAAKTSVTPAEKQSPKKHKQETQDKRLEQDLDSSVALKSKNESLVDNPIELKDVGIANAAESARNEASIGIETNTAATNFTDQSTSPAEYSGGRRSERLAEGRTKGNNSNDRNQISEAQLVVNEDAAREQGLVAEVEASLNASQSSEKTSIVAEIKSPASSSLQSQGIEIPTTAIAPTLGPSQPLVDKSNSGGNVTSVAAVASATNASSASGNGNAGGIATPPAATTNHVSAKRSSESVASYSSVERTNHEQTLTEYQQSRLLQRVLKGLERFSDGSSTVRLRLHPPELGALEVSLNMTQQKLSATVAVESETTRQVLQENLPKLQSKLAEQGIVVEKIEFKTQSVSESQHGSEFFQQQDSGGGQSGANGQPGQGRQFGEMRTNRLADSWLGDASASGELNPATITLTPASNINLRA